MASLMISAPALPARAARAGGAARTRRAQPVAMATKRIGKKDEPAPIGTADEPLLPGFGKQDNKVARANRDPSKYLSTQDVAKSPFNKKGTVDASGREGKGIGVYRFRDKYQGNIDTYAPIYNPEAFGDDIITGMSDEAFVKFIIPFAAVFASLPTAIALKGYGFLG